MAHRGGTGRGTGYRPTGLDGRPKKHVLDGPTKDGKDPRRAYVPGGRNETAEEKKKRKEEDRKREKEQERKEDRERKARNQRAGLDDDGEPRAKRPTGGADNYEEPFEYNNPATPTGATPEGDNDNMGDGGDDEPSPPEDRRNQRTHPRHQSLETGLAKAGAMGSMLPLQPMPMATMQARQTTPQRGGTGKGS